LLSPDGDDPIFVGINRLVAKGLNKGGQGKDSDSQFDAEDIFKLERMAFIVEIALAKARRNDSEIQINNKQDLFHALTDRSTFTRILLQADDTLKSTEYFKDLSPRQDKHSSPGG
jgi:hypothetical protein